MPSQAANETLGIADDGDEVMEVGMFSIQCQTTDGRAWQLLCRFQKDDHRMAPTLRAIQSRGTIETKNWKAIRRFGTFN